MSENEHANLSRRLRHEATLNPIADARAVMQLAADMLESSSTPKSPENLLDVVEADFRAYAARFQAGAPVLEPDLRKLDRLLKMLGRVDDEEDDGPTRLAHILAYRDRAYQERNRLVCLVARLALLSGWRAGTWRDPDGEPGFALVVGVELPTGQVSFHMDERDPVAPWTALPTFPGSYDQHTDVEKWDRLLRAVADIHAGATPDYARRAMQTAAALDTGPVGQLAREHLRVVRGELDRCPQCGNPEGCGPLDCNFCSDFRANEAAELRQKVQQLEGQLAKGLKSRIGAPAVPVWEIVEVFGHTKHVGMVTREWESGQEWIVVRSPEYVEHRRWYPWKTVRLSPRAIFRREQVDEARALRHLRYQTRSMDEGVDLPAARLASARDALRITREDAAKVVGLSITSYTAIEDCTEESDDAMIDDLVGRLLDHYQRQVEAGGLTIKQEEDGLWRVDGGTVDDALKWMLGNRLTRAAAIHAGSSYLANAARYSRGDEADSAADGCERLEAETENAQER